MARPALQLREHLTAPEQCSRPDAILPLLRGDPDLLAHAHLALDLGDHASHQPVPCNRVVVLEAGRRGDHQRAMVAMAIEQEQLSVLILGIRGRRRGLDERPQIDANAPRAVQQRRVSIDELADRDQARRHGAPATLTADHRARPGPRSCSRSGATERGSADRRRQIRGATARCRGSRHALPRDQGPERDQRDHRHRQQVRAGRPPGVCGRVQLRINATPAENEATGEEIKSGKVSRRDPTRTSRRHHVTTSSPHPFCRVSPALRKRRVVHI